MDSLERAREIKWHYFNQRKRSPFFNWISIDSLVTKKIPLTDLDSNSKSWLTIDGWNACPEEDFQQIRQHLASSIEKDPKFLLTIIDAYKHEHGKAMEVWQNIQRQDWRNKTNEELFEALNGYIDSRQSIDPWLNLPLLAEADLESKLKDELSKTFSNDTKAFPALTAPIYPSTQAEELKERTNIQSDEELQKHWHKYRWMSDTLMYLDYLPLEHFSKKEQVSTESNDDFNIYYAKIDDENLKTLIDTIQKSIWFRSFRIESFYHSSYIILNLLEEIAKRLEIEVKKLVYFTPPEILDFLEKENKPIVDEIKKREYGFIQFWQPQTFEMISGNEIDEWIKSIRPGYNTTSSNISGQVAFAGIAKGKAVIIKDVDELPKLLNKKNSGAVLVTHGTNPKYVPYLKNVSAIVTDEGGILCHAAIISREMKIPCIIGTKTATTTFNEGDLIEVNANDGTIKKVEGN